VLSFEVHEGRGPYALFVHGMLSSRSYWKANLDALSGVVRPVVVELLGHGRSPAPDDPAAYHPSAYVEHFDRIRRDLGTSRWFLCGHSLGGALTVGYALDRGEHVIAHVFTNSQSALAPAEWRQSVRARVEPAAVALERGGTAALEVHPFHPQRARHFPEDVKDALVAEYAEHSAVGVAGTLRHTVPESSVRERVQNNQVPALLTVGVREKDFAEPRRYAEATMPLLSVSELDAGHAVNVQAAAAFNTAVSSFFAAHA